MADSEFTASGHRKWTLNRKATCHPELPHYALGLCKKCYCNRPERKAKIKAHDSTPERRAKLNENAKKRNANGLWLRIKYGLSLEDYNKLLSDQDGGCAICKREDSGRERDKNRRLVVDHDHTTNQVRGLLCHRCNVGLGCFDDSPELMATAINYLQQKMENKTC